ncbi:MAG: hypothetical protein JO300_02875 [Silvibacterium sp.]|nr:hypothetical protein [Silvibacterium sp.]
MSAQEAAVKESQSTAAPSSRPAHFFVASDWACLLIAITSAVAGGAMVLKFFPGPKSAFVLLLLSAAVAGAMLWLRWIQLRRITLGRKWLVMAWCLFALLFAVLFPLSHQHRFGVGSDRDDALRVASAALVHGHYPYYGRTYFGNPITPLPGAVILATPFYLLGNVGLENLFWLAIFLWFSSIYFRERSTALMLVLLTLGAVSANLDDFVVGGDYGINGIYVAIALFAMIATADRDRPLILHIAACVLLGLAIDSRPTYIVVFPLVAAYLWQHSGPKVALRAVLISGLVAGVSSIPFYLYDPAHFGPLHVTHKLDMIPAKFRAPVVLPVAGLLIASVGFLTKLSVPRVYLLLGLSMLVMSGVPGILGWLFAGPTTVDGWYWLGWLSLPAFFILLWSLRVYEDNSEALRAANHPAAVP